MNLNKAMIIGNLTREPEVRKTPAGQSVASFSVATNFVWTDKQGQTQKKAEFHNIVAWGRLADICSQYLRKGAKIYVEGRLQTRDWTGQDGIKRFRTEIIAENMIMLDRMSGSQGGGDFQTPSFPSSDGGQFSQQSYDNGGVEEDEIKIENIPF